LVGVQVAPFVSCARHADALIRTKVLVAADRSKDDLAGYLASFKGARFDHGADRQPANVFPLDDFLAVRNLNVAVVRSAQAWCYRPIYLGRDR
jgi:hypothetical protein